MLRPVLILLLASAPGVSNAQAVAPSDHPGAPLAEAIAAQDCVLHQDDVNDVMAALDLPPGQFPAMAVPLMRDGYLMPSGDGTLTLVNWGACAGNAPDEAGATETDVDTEAEGLGVVGDDDDNIQTAEDREAPDVEDAEDLQPDTVELPEVVQIGTGEDHVPAPGNIAPIEDGPDNVAPDSVGPRPIGGLTD